MAKVTQIALIGYGYWGPNLLRNLLAHPQVEASFVCDLLPQNIEKLHRTYPQIPSTSDYREILDSPTIDAVVLAVPTPFHFDMASKALKAGKHVLVEKPMTATLSEARKLKELADQSKRVVCVDHPFVFAPVMQELKKMIDRNHFGTLYSLESRRMNLGIIQQSSNVISDLAPHDFSLVDYLFDGETPDSVTAVGFNHTKSGQVETADIALHYPSGKDATIHLSWLSPLKVRELILVGEKAMAVVDDIEPSEKLRIYDKRVEFSTDAFSPFAPFYRSGDVHIPSLESGEPLYRVIDKFVSAITTGSKPLHSIEAGIRVVSLLDRAQEALKKYQEGVSRGA